MTNIQRKNKMNNQVFRLATVSLLSSILMISSAQAVNKKSATVKAPTKKTVVSRSKSVPVNTNRASAEAMAMVNNGDYEHAVPRLYVLVRKSSDNAERAQLKYSLGISLLELNLYQVAAFQFVDIIRSNDARYTRQAIEKLMLAADYLGDDTLLNYAISKIQLQNLPEKNKDIIYYRLGEVKMKNAQFDEAAQSFSRVEASSRYYTQAKFNQGRALLEAKRMPEALRIFKGLFNQVANKSVTDINRVAVQMAIARTYYQAQQWDDAVEWYRNIPRDTDYWHEAMFEQSWAYMRSAKFRSALSNFQSLHSSYYDDVYMPEPLLLRSIVYLYICKYDEMEKVLDLFEKTYSPVQNSIASILKSKIDANSLFLDLDKVAVARKSGKSNIPGIKIPYIVAKKILDEGDVKRSFGYLRKLVDERKKWDANKNLGKGGLGVYASKILSNRIKNTRIAIGEMARNHMILVKNELTDLYDQVGFIRYEMTNGKKESLKKKIAGKDISEQQIDEKVNREFYIQNGYEYWPFDGEYWLDEIGNYHYLGKQSCE